ncbi:replicase protein [Bermuda grass latent virus]|nr:replicase protein [Bermuda grass latent virus]APQ46236.1 replicase protein [Bermuda grass latent virus]
MAHFSAATEKMRKIIQFVRSFRLVSAAGRCLELMAYYLTKLKLKYESIERSRRDTLLKIRWAIRWIKNCFRPSVALQVDPLGQIHPTKIVECSYGVVGGAITALTSTKHLGSKLVLGVLTAASIYCAVQLHIYVSLAKRRQFDKTRSDFLEQQYQDILKSMEEQKERATRERLEDCLTKEVLEPAQLAEDGTVLKQEVAQYLVHEHGKFVRALVCEAKMEFGGTPKTTEANQLAVWRFLYRTCDKRGLNPADAQRSITAALPFVFLPSAYDESAAIGRTSEETAEALRRYKSQFTQDTPLQKLVCNPLSGKAWRAWARNVFYGDQETGLHFSK